METTLQDVRQLGERVKEIHGRLANAIAAIRLNSKTSAAG